MDILFENLGGYWDGIQTTISLTVLSFFFAFLIGTVVAAARVSPVPPLQKAAATYTEMARNTPLTVLMLLFFFGLPDLAFLIPRFPTAVLVLSLYTGAFIAEAIRSGINAVGRGQSEAALSVGLGFSQMFGLIVLPQALRTVVPPIANLFIALTKNSSIAFVISVTELTGTARLLGSATARPLEAFTGAAIGYLLLTIPAGYLFGILERKVAIKR